MFKTKKILVFSILAVICLNFAFVLDVFAEACQDADNDGYVVITGYEDGNYSKDEWTVFFDEYKKNSPCDDINFKKGGEPERCDAPVIKGPNAVLQSGEIVGKKVHPGAVDGPNNGVDEDCDGADGKFIQGQGGSTDVSSLFDKIINILGYYVVGGVSVVVLLWGGLMYTTAAGDDMKLSKARKAMVGAIVGLIIGISAPSIIRFVIENVIG